jgi:hypothetical protein
MISHFANGKEYRIPNGLNAFQLELYVHLIDWKWRNITTEPGKVRDIEYDAILPDSFQGAAASPLIYPGIEGALTMHRKKNDFRIHTHFYHMASSQAANINLFLPLLTYPNAAAIFSRLKPDFAALATEYLDHGYCIEFWGGNFEDRDIASSSTGPLADKSAMAGTDSDIAIAYRDHQGELCLWLIEHKLTEKEFTECGGFKSKGRQARHDCAKSLSGLLQDKDACYYQSARKFKYWEITECNQTFFVHHDHHTGCPFKGGMNQLWRNQLLGLAIEQGSAQLYRHVSFSVVKHPRNDSLDSTLASYQALIGGNPKFSVFQSDELVRAAEAQGDSKLNEWAEWYRGLYKI